MTLSEYLNKVLPDIDDNYSSHVKIGYLMARDRILQSIVNGEIVFVPSLDQEEPNQGGQNE